VHAEQGTLGDRVIRGAAWIGSGRLGVRLIGVISTLILARLLTPEDFGLVAVAMAFVGMLSQMSAFGFNEALIRFQEPTTEDYATAWTLNAARGVAVSLLLLGLAGPIASFYGDERVAPVLAVVAVIPLVNGFENVRFIDFEKKMNFRPLSAVMVGVKLLSFITAVTIAIITRSYWALIAGTVMAACVRLIVTYWLVPYRPWLTLSSWRKLMDFSGWLVGANFLQAINLRADEAILQKIMAAHAVGVFYIAKDLVRTPMREVVAPVRRALFPGLSELSPDSAAFRRAYFATVSGLFMVVAPIGLGIAVVADEAVPLLLGEQWLDAIIPMQIFGAQMAIGVLGQAAISCAMASGNTRMWFDRNVILVPIRLGLFIPGAIYGGINGAVAALFVAGMISTYLNLAMANRVIGSSILDHLKPCWRTFVSGGVLVGAVALVDWSIADAERMRVAHAGLQLGTQVLVGAVVYPVCHVGLWWSAGRPAGPEARILELGSRSRLGKFAGRLAG